MGLFRETTSCMGCAFTLHEGCFVFPEIIREIIPFYPHFRTSNPLYKGISHLSQKGAFPHVFFRGSIQCIFGLTPGGHARDVPGFLEVPPSVPVAGLFAR